MEQLTDNRINKFIESVCSQIFTEEEAIKIKDELVDHIDCLTESYEKSGYKKEEAVSKSLLQMGDPKEIGYSFTNFDLMKKRKLTLKLLKILSLISLVVSFIGLVYLSILEPNSALPSISDAYLPLHMLIVFNLCVYGSNLNKKIKFLEVDTSPLLIIWPVKSKIVWEYVIVSLIFSPLLLLFFFLIGLDVISSDYTMEIFLIFFGFIISVFTFFYSEKFRIPKYMILEEGIIISEKFLSWTAINSIKWKYHHVSGEKRYSMSICITDVAVAKTIKVGASQKNMINKIIYSRL